MDSYWDDPGSVSNETYMNLWWCWKDIWQQLLFSRKVRLKPGTSWRQSWIQHGQLCWNSTKSAVSLWPRTHWQQSRLYRQQSWTYWQQSRLQQTVEFTLLPICCRFRQQSTFSKVDCVEFNFVATVYRALQANAFEQTLHGECTTACHLLLHINSTTNAANKEAESEADVESHVWT